MSAAVSRRQFWARFWFAGPWAVVAAMLMMTGMTTYLPAGEAQVNNLMIPLILFPLIWAAFFFHACMDVSLRRVALVSFGISVVNVVFLVNKFV